MLSVEPGTQLAFLAIPVADGMRLGGDFRPLVDVDSTDVVVPDSQVLAVQEGGITEIQTTTYYAVETGTATLRFSDPNHGTEVQRQISIRSAP